MCRKLAASFFITLSIFGAAKAIAVDLSGQVITSDGTPICALVLASGKNTFSCGPSGPFELTGLPTEPDGTIKLQVYADGFLPNVTTLRNFGYQTVTMTRAGSCPVDDGLSGGSLDGVYQVLRATVHYNDDTIIDSAGPGFSVSGNLVVSGNTMSLQASATIDGQTSSISTNATFVDNSYYLDWREQGFSITERAAIVERGDKLVMSFNSNAIGEDFNEITYFAKVSGASSVRAASTLIQGSSFSSNLPGIGFGELIQLMGAQSLLED
jgi:hypothetical protein